MARYLGIDVHRDSSTICVLSATGKRVTREVVETNGHALVDYVRRLRGKLHVCIEEGTWSEWLYEILSPHVVELVVYQNEWTPRSQERRDRCARPGREAADRTGRPRSLQGSGALQGAARVGAGLPSPCHRHDASQEPLEESARTPRHPLHRNEVFTIQLGATSGSSSYRRRCVQRQGCSASSSTA